MGSTIITRKAIKASFLSLLSEKSLSKITVRDVTDRCGINRNTFYYHYQDIPALLEEICSEEFDKIVVQYPRINSLDECLEAAMLYARRNQRVVTHIFNSVDNSVYISSLWRVCEHVITTYADTVFPDVPISDEDRQLFIRYHKCALFGLIIDWISSGMNEEYVAGMRRICTLRSKTSELIIQNCIDSYAHPDPTTHTGPTTHPGPSGPAV